MNSPTAQKDSRLHIRTSPGQKALLAQAAQARHLNVSQFVLQTCLEAAEKVVREKAAQPDFASAIRVSATEYDWLMQKLEEPPQGNAALRRVLTEPTIWDE